MRLVLIVFVIAAVTPPCVAAQPAPAEPIATQLKSGDTVYVVDTTLREITGVFGKVSDSTITLMVNGELRDIAFSDVRRITRRGGDPLWNGVLLGAGVGVLAGAPAGAGVAVGFAVVYGSIGAFIDWAVPGRVVVYRAPAAKTIAVGPLVTGGRRGVRVSISF
jgi:hypothetical protein